MAYTPNIPASTDIIANSQSQLQANSNAIDSEYNADHDGFSLGSSNSGMHNQITFLANQSAPSLTRNLVAGVAGLYINAGPTNPELFYQNGTVSAQQLTNYPVSTQASTGTGYSGTLNGVTLPGGMKICYSAPNAQATSVSPFAVYTFPFTYTSAPSVQVTSNESTVGQQFVVIDISTTQCTIKSKSGTNNPITIVVIGI
jgi:hypothetical protein